MMPHANDNNRPDNCRGLLGFIILSAIIVLTAGVVFYRWCQG